ncbi:MAG: histidine kinase [Anaerolineales bacterium]
MTENKIELIKKEINDLKKRWPAHSVPAAMMEQLDELESQLADELEKLHLEKEEKRKEVNQE